MSDRLEQDSTTIQKLLAAKRIAVVGISANPMRDSHRVSRYLLDHGYDVVPVNPTLDSVFDRECHPSLAAIDGPIDVVNVFRTPSALPAIVEEAIECAVPGLWLQLGVVHKQAIERARNAGIECVVDRCIMVEHRRFAAA